MFDQLPAELYMYTIETAAYRYRFSDRQSVVNLAMCSHTVYDIVAPILYHTLFVTRDNASRLSSLASSKETCALAKRIFSHVHSYHNRSSQQNPFSLRLMVNLASLTASNSALFCSWTPPKLKSIHLINASFSSALLRLRSGHLRTVTHMSGCLPVSSQHADWDTFFADPAGWMRSLLGMLPAVTHLGMTHELPRSNDSKGSTTRFDCAAVGTAVRTALQEHPRLQCIAIRAWGIFCETRRTELKTVLRDVRDPRVKVWLDMRPMKDWDQHSAITVRDANEGRSLWTEARPL